MHLLAAQFPELSLDALFSIYGQEFSRKLRQTHGKFVRSIESLEKRYLHGEDVFDIAMNVDFPACQLMRLIIESVLKVNHKSVGKMLKHPYDGNAFPSEVPEDSRAMTSGLNSNKGKKLIERLKVDCERVVAWDFGASPATERSRREAGLEYEKILEDALTDIGAQFETETDLRAEGASRTPDVRLKVPISVLGRTIHWIDSKASFCDPQVHEESGSKHWAEPAEPRGPCFRRGFAAKIHFSPRECVLYRYGKITRQYNGSRNTGIPVRKALVLPHYARFRGGTWRKLESATYPGNSSHGLLRYIVLHDPMSCLLYTSPSPRDS